MKQVTAVCRTERVAKRAVEELAEARFSIDDVSVLLVDHGKVESVPVEQRTAMAVTLPAGIVSGAALGVVLAAVGIVPGLMAAGPIATALKGALAGTAVGALGGTLSGLGWWKNEPQIPASALDEGAVLVGIGVPDARLADALEALRRAGASDVVAS